MTSVSRVAVAPAVLILMLAPRAVQVAAQPAAQPKVLESQDSNAPGVVAELLECKRSNGVLTIKMRLRNTGTSTVRVPIIVARNYDKYYVTAEGKKYFLLKDSEGAALSAQAGSSGDLEPQLTAGHSFQWWGQYPAPPATVKTVSFYTPLTAPFMDVPISGS